MDFLDLKIGSQLYHLPKAQRYTIRSQSFGCIIPKYFFRYLKNSLRQANKQTNMQKMSYLEIVVTVKERKSQGCSLCVL